MRTANLLRVAPCRVQAWPTPPIGKPKSRHRDEAVSGLPARTQCPEAPRNGCANMVNKVLIAGAWADCPRVHLTSGSKHRRRRSAGPPRTKSRRCLRPQPSAISVRSSEEDRRASKRNFGSPGIGSSPHLAAEMLKKVTGTDAVHVPYRGAAPALNELACRATRLPVRSRHRHRAREGGQAARHCHRHTGLLATLPPLIWINRRTTRCTYLQIAGYCFASREES